MIRIEHHESFYIEDQPGDGTKYLHIIFRRGNEIIFATPSLLYSGYFLNPSEINNFMERRYPELKEVSYDHYGKIVSDSNALNDYYIAYIIVHASKKGEMNPWTALSVIRSIYATGLTKKEIE